MREKIQNKEGITSGTEGQESSSEVFALEPGFLREEDKEFSVSLDGTHWLGIPSEHGTWIKTASTVQDSVYAGKHKRIAESFRHMNCRKTVFVTTGQMTLEEALKGEDVAGVTHLFADAVRLQDEVGNAPIVGDHQFLEISTFLESHPEQLPAVVHMFGVRERHKELIDMMLPTLPWAELEDSLHRYHTFLVYGKDDAGRWVCFHKSGAGNEPIGIVTLEDAVHSFKPSEDGTELLSVIGPV